MNHLHTQVVWQQWDKLLHKLYIDQNAKNRAANRAEQHTQHNHLKSALGELSSLRFAQRQKTHFTIFQSFFYISDCNVQMLWEWGETKVQKEGECMSFFSKWTTPQLVDIHHSITETGNDKNARRSFNSWSYTSTLLWGRTINQLWLTSPVVWSTHQWNRKACLAHTFPPMQSPSMLLVQDPWGTATQNFTYSSHSKPQLFINSVRYSSSAVKIPLLLSNAHRLLSR